MLRLYCWTVIVARQVQPAARGRYVNDFNINLTRSGHNCNSIHSTCVYIIYKYGPYTDGDWGRRIVATSVACMAEAPR